ncbi:MAG: pitrilysin family protein [Anaerovoracaceae bacterium]
MIKTKTLDCGTTVVMEQIPYVQSVSIGVWAKVGSVDEPSRLAGVSHFVEHMMFKGTGKRTARQIASDVDKIGGHMNAFTGKEATCYYIKTLSDNLDQAVEILLDMVLNSKLDKEEMDKERMVICEEIKMIQDSPDDDAHDTICDLIFKGDPLSKSIIGTPSSLDNITSKSMRNYIKKEYTRDNVVISIAGNFDEYKISEMLSEKLDKLNPTKEERPKVDGVFAQNFRVKVKDIEQSHICMGTRGVKLEDDRYFALALLNNVLGGSMSSRLFQSIREQKGLAYSVYSMASSFCESGYFNIYAGVAHGKIRATIEAIKEEMAILKKDGITQEELSTAKEQMKSAYTFAQENVNGRMVSIGRNMTLSRKIHTMEDVIKSFNNVNMDHIGEVIDLIGEPREYCGVAVTNKKIPLKSIIQG